MKTNGWKRKFISMLLMISLTLSGITFGGEPVNVEAADSLPIVNEADVTARVKDLAVKLGLNGNLNPSEGVLFTANGKACVHSAKQTSCNNCKNEYVIGTQNNWFHKTFGYTVNVNNLPGQYGTGVPYSDYYPRAYTCIGFANFALWYISKENSSSNVYRKMLGTKAQPFTKANLINSGVRIGDIINASNATGNCHSVMFLAYNGDSSIKVLDCNWPGTKEKICVKIHNLNYSTYSIMTITRAQNYQPDSAGTGTAPAPSPSISLPAAMTSASSAEAKTNIINYAAGLGGWNRDTFVSAGRSDIPSGDWCTWFLKLCADRVGVGKLFSASTDVSGFCTDMIKNYKGQAYYYTDSSYLTDADKKVLSGAKAVTKATFSPQPGDIYILHEKGFSGLSQVGMITDVADGAVAVVVGNNGTAKEVQLRSGMSNTFYQINHTACPIVAYIRPNYASLDKHVCSGTLTPEKQATCTKKGNIAYYVCSCGKWYYDKACKSQIKKAEDVEIPALGHSFQGTPRFLDYSEHEYLCDRGCKTTKREKHEDKDENFLCDICGSNILDPAKEGLHVQLVDPDRKYVYTGSEIKPEIVVTNNGVTLLAGVDYTVKYSNNIRSSEGKTENGKPRITVTGKGNFTGSNYTTFEILPKDIRDSDVVAGGLSVAEGTRAVPVITHNGRKLTAADYTVEDAAKKYTEDGALKVSGKGNYTGTISIPVKVVKASALKKFRVNVGNEKLIYNGKPQKISFTVTDAAANSILTENKDYQVVYPINMTNAGTVRFSVIGIGEYTGTVVKSYKINPLAVRTGMQVTGVKPEGYPYNARGVTIGSDLTVTYDDGANREVLKEGRDYRITYSNNKKVSASGASAKYTISFLGNYKGSRALSGNYRIYSSGLNDATPGLKITVADKYYNGRPGTYQSAPIVTVGGVKLAKSSYKVSYYLDAEMTREIKGSANRVTLRDDEAFATVYVKITGRGSYAPADGTVGYATASYKVCNKNVYKDLSKARVTFWDDDGRKITKASYTGREIRPRVKVEVKTGKNYVEVPSDQYRVTYMNNIYKGKATVVITGTGAAYGGSRTATFQITAQNIKSIADLWKGLFGR